MVVYKDKHFKTRSDRPDDDFIGNADYVVPDGSELAQKIMDFYPNFDFILNDDGTKIVDVVVTESQPMPPAITQEQRLTAAENAIEEIINLIMEG